MRNHLIHTSVFVILLSITSVITVDGQFPIKIPGLPKVEKPKPDSSQKSGSSAPTASEPSSASSRQPGGTKFTYENEMRPSVPAVIQALVFIQAANSNSYWKMPNASNVTSWLPEINAIFVYDDRAPIDAFAEWYNPDGSLWFTEKLQPGAGTFGLSLRSNETWNLIDSKSTNAVGLYSVKIKNKATGAVIYSAKFRVGKFLASFNAADKNKLGFYVDHDWLVPLGVVGLETDDLTKGAPPYLLFSTWLKGEIEHDQLEGQLFHNGSLIAKRPATSGMAYEERISKFTVPFDKDNKIKRWQFQFQNVRFKNGLPVDPEYHGNLYLIDEKPGAYIFKLFRNGTQIREISFTVGPDGRLVRPAYSDAFRFPQHSILLPAKVLGNQEKWNPVNAKADIFYGNPISGFTVQY